ncbi:glutathione S-transferase Mu 1 [Trichonephila clavata]|uniref:glutathione transferase n=1 Tax=Trichonephila clavata TaxID=2740835 RepID=A0A8X6GWT5_TRICU|nr:glutathione S-transferase Mu 1 [Trichonephila clavata]
MVKSTLGYWNIRGLAQPIRYLLHHEKEDFEDRRYLFTDYTWKNEKNALGLDFPNLPYYIDGDIRITQSTAILRYLGRKYGLDGKNEWEKLRVSLAEQQIVELRADFIELAYFSDFKSEKDRFIETIPDKLKPWEEFIGNQEYLIGQDITYVDFIAFETFDYYRLLHADALVGFPNIRAYHHRMKNLPKLRDYMDTTFKPWPICGVASNFGGGLIPPKHL